MSFPSLSTRRWCCLISSPGNDNIVSEIGGLISKFISSAKADMIFLIVSSSLSSNVNTNIFPIVLISLSKVYSVSANIVSILGIFNSIIILPVSL